ncbi:phage holin family protein [Leucobacter sp. 1207-22]|uniref:phage holin family protein n=1 Tax=Leucobacter sp. 1207-22 TaxID=2604456 RepID=UPI004064BD6F
MSPRKDGSPGTVELIARLPYQIVRLAKAEINNAKVEVIAKAKKAGIGAGAIVIALFFLFFMLEALVIAAIAALAIVWPWWLAALTVAGALLLLAAGAIAGGIALIRRGNPVPDETLGRLNGDLEALSEVQINASAKPQPSAHRVPQVGEQGNWR